jgi:hypothetical protein
MDKIKLDNLATDTYNRQSYNQALLAIQMQINRAVDGYLFPVRRITTNYTMDLNDSIILVDATAGNVTVTLQAALQWEQKRLIVKKIDASVNTVTIDANSTELIDGAATKVISTQYTSHEFTSQGGAVWII